MEPVTVGIISIIFLLGLLGLGVSIGLAFILVSFLGISIILGLSQAISFLGITMYHSIASPSWCSIPVFVLKSKRGSGLAMTYFSAMIACC